MPGNDPQENADMAAAKAAACRHEFGPITGTGYKGEYRKICVKCDYCEIFEKDYR